MPKKNTANISGDAKSRLDQFIELNYPKLMAYALYVAKNPNEAQVLLHDTIQQLYEGKRTLNLDGYPLVHFQHLLKSTRSHSDECRQAAFENGYRVTVRANKKETIPIRVTYGLPGDLQERMGVTSIPSFLKELEEKDQYTDYLQFKPTLSRKNQIILTMVEEGHSIQTICTCLADQGIHHSKDAINSLLARLLKRITRKIGTVHLQVG